MTDVSNQQLHILRHTLGLRDDGSGRSYRNHFVTGPGSTDFDNCEALLSMGLMRKSPGHVLTGGDQCYLATPAGITLATTPPEE